MGCVCVKVRVLFEELESFKGEKISNYSFVWMVV